MGEEVTEIDRDTVCLCVCVTHTSSTPSSIKSHGIPHMKAMLLCSVFGPCPGLSGHGSIFLSFYPWRELFQFQHFPKILDIDVHLPLFKSSEATSTTFNL